MKTDAHDFLTTIRLGEAQANGNMTLFPILGDGNGAPDYLTLGEAITASLLTVSEVSEGGSVPNLRVVNRCDRPVLLVDGEELIGAKQNRVLNTSILLKERSETVVPVSCTEQGRWRHVSAAFADAGLIMSHRSRSRKSRSVSDSLARHSSYESNQGAVWHDIAALHAKAQTSSPTGAMHDVFAAHRRALEQGMKAFVPIPDQTGLLVLIDGEVAGFDLFAHAETYRKLHERLLKSYVVEAMFGAKQVNVEEEQARQKATSFLAEASQCTGSSFPSVGHGFDVRFVRAGITGAALVHEDRVIHSAFHHLPPESKTDDPGLVGRRRRWFF